MIPVWECQFHPGVTFGITILTFTSWTDTQFTSDKFDSKSTTDLFSIWDPWNGILSNGGLEPNLSLLRGPWHKSLRKPCSNLIPDQICMCIFDMRLQSQRKRANLWGVSLAWLQLDVVSDAESGSDYHVLELTAFQRCCKATASQEGRI